MSDSATREIETGEVIDAAEFTRRTHELVPVARQLGIVATELGADGSAVVRLPYAPEFVRPGGSISGPTLMALADIAMYAGVAGRLGWTPMAMTATQNTTFLKPPRPEGLIASAEPLRFGPRLAYFAVVIASDSVPETPVAHVTGSYALPQAR
ncbi:MAG: PaaI family thioesterase [Alphaproteobacteria bacterium]